MNKTDNTDNIYVNMQENLHQSIMVYDGNQKGLTYDFYWIKPHKVYDVSSMSIIPEVIRKIWSPSILTRDQWSKFLNLMSLLSVPILSHRFDVEINESRFTKIFMSSFDPDFIYQLKRDTLSDNRILITVIDTPSCQEIRDTRIYKPFIPYDKGMEDKIRTYLDGITRFLRNNIPYTNQLIAEQQDIRKR